MLGTVVWDVLGSVGPAWSVAVVHWDRYLIAATLDNWALFRDGKSKFKIKNVNGTDRKMKM